MQPYPNVKQSLEIIEQILNVTVKRTARGGYYWYAPIKGGGANLMVVNEAGLSEIALGLKARVRIGDILPGFERESGADSTAHAAERERRSRIRETRSAFIERRKL